MANWNAKSYLIGMKFGTRGFLISPITNSSKIHRNSKFRVQYGAPKCEKLKVMPQRLFCGLHFSDDRHSVRMSIWGFLGRWLSTWPPIFAIQYSGSKMAAEILKNYLMMLKDASGSKMAIKNWKNSSNFAVNLYKKLFQVADYRFDFWLS